MIFILRDHYNATRDIAMAKHIMDIHKCNNQNQNHSDLPIDVMRKYINYCRQHCPTPIFSEDTRKKLCSQYVLLRNTKEKNSNISIGVRQLEAIIRTSQALAKMQMKTIVTESHLEEALRLFKVSTLNAMLISNVRQDDEPNEMVDRVENQIRRRFALGTHVSEVHIILTFINQKYPEDIIRRALGNMLQRKEIAYRMQGKMFIRLC